MVTLLAQATINDAISSIYEAKDRKTMDKEHIRVYTFTISYRAIYGFQIDSSGEGVRMLVIITRIIWVYRWSSGVSV